MTEFNKKFRYDDINGSQSQKEEAIRSAKNFANRVNGKILFEDGGDFILPIDGRRPYYANQTDWPSVTVAYIAEKEIF